MHSICSVLTVAETAIANVHSKPPNEPHPRGLLASFAFFFNKSLEPFFVTIIAKGSFSGARTCCNLVSLHKHKCYLTLYTHFPYDMCTYTKTHPEVLPGALIRLNVMLFSTCRLKLKHAKSICNLYTVS